MTAWRVLAQPNDQDPSHRRYGNAKALEASSGTSWLHLDKNSWRRCWGSSIQDVGKNTVKIDSLPCLRLSSLGHTPSPLRVDIIHGWLGSFSVAHWSRIGADESTRQIWLADDMVETATHQRGACTPPRWWWWWWWFPDSAASRVPSGDPHIARLVPLAFSAPYKCSYLLN